MPALALSDVAATVVQHDGIKRLGLLALATDLTTERDFARLIPQRYAALHTARLAYENPTTPDNLLKMAPRLTAAAELLVPGVALDAICYGCTAASVVIGDNAIAEAVNAARPGVPVVTPAAAARLALAALGVSRVAILTPYLIDTSRPIAAYFQRFGVEVTRLHCFGIDDDRAIARVAAESIIAAALRVDNERAEALFISCTALPAAALIAEIEARCAKPVVTANQASAWALLRYAGISGGPDGFGQLFALGLPA